MYSAMATGEEVVAWGLELMGSTNDITEQQLPINQWSSAVPASIPAPAAWQAHLCRKSCRFCSCQDCPESHPCILLLLLFLLADSPGSALGAAPGPGSCRCCSPAGAPLRALASAALHKLGRSFWFLLGVVEVICVQNSLRGEKRSVQEW